MTALTTLKLNSLLQVPAVSQPKTPALRRREGSLFGLGLVAATSLALHAGLVLSWVTAGAW